MNATYASPDVQKEFLYIFSNKVKGEIRQKIHETSSCIIMDEARDESKKEQMILVLRFVDKERFFNIVTGSCKLNDELKEAQAHKLLLKIVNDELESRRGLDQIGTLKRYGNTH